jgi:hypothetical protein
MMLLNIKLYSKPCRKMHNRIKSIFEFLSQLGQLLAAMFMKSRDELNEIRLFLERPLQTYDVIECSIRPKRNEAPSKSGNRMELDPTLETRAQDLIHTCP